MRRVLDLGLPLVAGVGLIAGGYSGLALAPPDRDMGDVYRILFVHVPSAWTALLAVTVTFVASIVYLLKSSWVADAIAEASAQIGVVFGALLIVQGCLWGKPTWGVYWTWDPRLTTSAILLFAFAGYLALRQFVDDPERRATWAAVAAVIIYVDVPITWFSVRWWRSLHQTQSMPSTLGSWVLGNWALNVFVFLVIYLWFVRLRYRIVRRRQIEELAEPPSAAITEGAS
jgi:heme exporter protein C